MRTRERQFIDALAIYYSDPDHVTPAVRAERYANAMAGVARDNTNDAEAQIFYALALLASPPPTDKTHANQKRAAAILEAYVSKASLMALRDERRTTRDGDETEMSRGEALEVLGLEPGADEAEIRAAHKRLLRLVHPDRGGSAYLARRVYQARDALLVPSQSKTRAGDDERA